MYINLHSLARSTYYGESHGYINLNNYDVITEVDDYEKYQEYKENGLFNDSTFLALPQIEGDVYRELQYKFLEKYYPRKAWYFRKLNNRDFEQCFHETVEESTLSDDWYEYKYEFRIKLLQEWCENNSIRYSLKKS